MAVESAALVAQERGLSLEGARWLEDLATEVHTLEFVLAGKRHRIPFRSEELEDAPGTPGGRTAIERRIRSAL